MGRPKSKSGDELIQEAIKDKKMVDALGVEHFLSDVFALSDFRIGENKDVYIRHFALLNAAKKLFGGICARRVDIQQSPTASNKWCAVATVEYCFKNSVTWRAAADCRIDTATVGFSKYTTALAETRASARCLREALGVELCSAEEVAAEDQEGEIIKITDETPIASHQIVVLERKFIKEYGFSLSDICKIIGREIFDIKDMTRKEAEQVIEELNGLLKDKK